MTTNQTSVKIFLLISAAYGRVIYDRVWNRITKVGNSNVNTNIKISVAAKHNIFTLNFPRFLYSLIK